MAMTLDEFKRYHNSRKETAISMTDGYRQRDMCGNWEMSERYYEGLGRLVEQHPIVSPRVRRG